jgi:hypothetical protein
MLAVGRRVPTLDHMKLNAALAKSLLMAASIGIVVPMVAQTPAKPKTVKPAPVPVEEPATIPGIELPRQKGGFIGVTVEGPRLVVKFYDADKKPAAVDVARAAARWDPINKTSDVRTVLNPDAEGKALVSPLVVQPPLVFKVYLTLLDAEGNSLESHIADLKKLKAPKE